MKNFSKQLICLLVLLLLPIAYTNANEVEVIPTGRYSLITPLIESHSWWFKFDSRTGDLWKVKWNKKANKIQTEGYDCSVITDDGGNYDGRFELQYFYQSGADADHCTFIIFDKKEGRIFTGNSSKSVVYPIE